MTWRYLFVVTYGRSGSTLLQGILNSIPGYLIRGENGGALYHLFRFHSTIEWERDQNRRGQILDSRSPYFGIDEYASDQAVSDMRALVVRNLLRPSPGVRVVGFKEIRWFQREWEDYLDFIERLFPDARFIINTRNLNEVAKSQWWAKCDDPLATLTRQEERLDRIAERLDGTAYRVHYDDYVADSRVLSGLFAWLGEPFDRSVVDDVMSRRHSY